jgi:hypothetical protein
MSLRDGRFVSPITASVASSSVQSLQEIRVVAQLVDRADPGTLITAASRLNETL